VVHHALVLAGPLDPTATGDADHVLRAVQFWRADLVQFWRAAKRPGPRKVEASYAIHHFRGYVLRR
jgi:LPS sulfotransferase NodH